MRILLLICFGAIFACQQAEKAPSKPNILFLFADDLTHEAIGALGNSVVKTPNLDRLFTSGTAFTHAYNMGGWNGAVCIASRSMIMSGRHIWQAHDFEKKWQARDSLALQQTWSKLLEGAGYTTYMTGKWHVKAPAEEVYQHVGTVRPGMPPDAWPGAKVGQKLKDGISSYEDLKAIMPPGYFYPDGPDDRSWSPTDSSFGGFWSGGTHWSEVLKNEALGFIDQASENPDDPFFMYLAFNAPHDPRQAPQAFLDLYPMEDIPVPENWLTEYPYKDSIGLGPGLRDEALAPFPRTEFAIKKHIQEYYAIISHMDAQIGKILEALDASGLAENTYIFFTADHGLSVGHHGLLGKQNMYDHSLRVPLLIHGPDIPSNQKNNAPVYLQDIMATALEIAEVNKPDYVDFKSFLPLARDGQVASYPAIYGCYTTLQRSVIKDDLKLIVYPKIELLRLYDLKNDPLEMHDLASNPDYSTAKDELSQQLLELQKSMQDPLDLNFLLNKN